MFQKKITVTAAAAVLALTTAGPAFADCAADLELITAAAETATLSDTDKAKVEEMKAAAMEKQNAGDDAGCVADLAMAKSILQLN